MKPLSEQLANLSVHAKNTEQAAAAAQKEVHDKVVARVAQAQTAAEQAVQKASQNISDDIQSRLHSRYSTHTEPGPESNQE